MHSLKIAQYKNTFAYMRDKKYIIFSKNIFYKIIYNKFNFPLYIVCN